MTTRRIAMWSGPRNISTAMMRSFENRADTAVWDEPLYGPYLAITGLAHPMAEEVIAEQGRDWRPILDRCAGDAPHGASVFYQKHMTHHLLDEMPLDWLDDVVSCFLIRDPREVVASYTAKRAKDVVTAEDLGFVQQSRVFDTVLERTGVEPPVIDAADVLRNPAGVLGELCSRIGITFDPAMLSWPAGRRESDGVWSAHWYDAVWKSTGFAPYQARDTRLDDYQTGLLEACQPHYDRLAPLRIIV